MKTRDHLFRSLQTNFFRYPSTRISRSRHGHGPDHGPNFIMDWGLVCGLWAQSVASWQHGPPRRFIRSMSAFTCTPRIHLKKMCWKPSSEFTQFTSGWTKLYHSKDLQQWPLELLDSYCQVLLACVSPRNPAAEEWKKKLFHSKRWKHFSFNLSPSLRNWSKNVTESKFCKCLQQR